MKKVLLLVTISISFLFSAAQDTYTWNGTVSTDWNNAANWTPNGVPGSADNVILITGSNTCTISTDQGVNNFTLDKGTLDLNSHTFTVYGEQAALKEGSVINGIFSIQDAVNASIGQNEVLLDAEAHIRAQAVFLQKTTFEKELIVTRAGSSTNYSNGENIFNGPVTINNEGGNNMVLSFITGDEFNNEATFNNTGNGNIIIAEKGGGNKFNSTIKLNNSSPGTGSIYVSRSSSGTIFNGDIIISSSSDGNIQIGTKAGPAITLNDGHTIAIGPEGFSNGKLTIFQLAQQGNTPIDLTATGSATLQISSGVILNGPIKLTAPNIYLDGAVYNGTVSLTKTDGAASNNSKGGNVFNSVFTANYISSSGTGYFSFGYGEPDIFNGDVYLNNDSRNRIILAHYSTGNELNGNVYLSSKGSSIATHIGYENSGIKIAAGKSIFTYPGDFEAGQLNITGFTQTGNDLINIVTTGTASVALGSTTSPVKTELQGPISIESPDIYLNGTTFNDPVTITKTGGSSNHNNGYKNIFNSDITINQFSNSGYFTLGYNSDDEFNGDIIINETGSGGIKIGSNGTTGTPVMSAGNTIRIGSIGVSNGYLNLHRFKQLGNKPMELNFTGATTQFLIANDSEIGGDLTVVASRPYFNGATFHGNMSATQTGDAGINSTGGNRFEGIVTLNNTGNGNLQWGTTNPDIFENDVYVRNTSSKTILLAYSSSGNEFNGNIFVSQTGTALGISIARNANGSATMAAGKTISTSGAAFDVGELRLTRFHQLGDEPIDLDLGVNATMVFGETTQIGGNVNVTAGGFLLHGTTFDGTVDLTKTGSANNVSNGGNIFNQSFVFTNKGSGYLIFGNEDGDHFKGEATFNNTGSSNLFVARRSFGNIFEKTATFNNLPADPSSTIYVSTASEGTLFNDNIIVNSVDGNGVQFCTGTVTASATLAPGKTISVGSEGFKSGNLLLKQFTQNGNTPQQLLLEGSAMLVFGPNSSFGGDILTESPGLRMETTTFNGSVTNTKTGSSNDQSKGGNIYNGPFSFTNNGTGYLILANSNGNTYNDDVTFVKNSTGLIYPNYNASNVYKKNIYIQSNSVITFGNGTGTTIMQGDHLQKISAAAGTSTPVFKNLIIDNSGDGVELEDISVNVSVLLTLTRGLLHTSDANMITLLRNAAVALGNESSQSYVSGPMQYEKASSGTSTLNFPIGNENESRPVALTVNHTNSTSYFYRATLYNESALYLGFALPATVDQVSEVHYYQIDRTDAAGTSQPTAGLTGAQTIQIFFGENDRVTNGGELTIVKNNVDDPNQWYDIGGSGAPADNGGYLSGNITSTSAPATFSSFGSYFALGNLLEGMNVLPVQIADLRAVPTENKFVDIFWNTEVESNNHYFTLEKSSDGVTFIPMAEVPSQAVNGYSNVQLKYRVRDEKPASGINYYRLKQTDKDGKSQYFQTVSAHINGGMAISVYPNPASNYIIVKGLPSTQDNLKAEWFDWLGRLAGNKIIQPNGGSVQIETPARAGMYLLRISNKEGKIMEQKVVVNKK